MVKNLLSVVLIASLMASCSSMKPMALESSKRTTNNVASSSLAARGPEVKFIDDIVVTPEETIYSHKAVVINKPAPANTETVEKANRNTVATSINRNTFNLESASKLQLKYAILLDTEVEQLRNVALLENIDDWFGTRYRYGGTTKKGIDCSAFVQNIFTTVYGTKLPRTAREQYKLVERIGRTELKEGDLVFFNTTGGVSHVGIYLQNNKFVHASVSKGVTVDDMYSDYYLKRFIGAGRIS